MIVAEPDDTPVTGTNAVAAFAPIVTAAGTVATAELLEFSVIVTPPAGAGLESVSERFCVPGAVIVTLPGVKLMVPVPFALPTRTTTLADG
jgi:hypothetical protein